MGVKNNKKGLFSKIIVGFIIVANIIFTIAVLGVFLNTQVEPSTLIMSWFSFTTVELWSLASIKKTKTRNTDVNNTIGDDSIG